MMIMSAFNQKLGGEKNVGKRADHVTRKTIQIKPLPFFFFVPSRHFENCLHGGVIHKERSFPLIFFFF
ncbi:Uncharacterized protein APZ42_023671 [Daphnia magna]|uniref:Uncharacterized protein n=1 Tax=Daphnia magna TaxID=35525 RepID=A0A164UR77_9CRUS|nr:Uncharacterized protein APZ42_023671 [Daphnia magna]